MNPDNFDCLGILYANLFELAVVGPRGVDPLFCPLLAKFVPFLKFLKQHLLTILFPELPIVHLSNTFNHSRIIVFESILSDLSGLFKVFGEVDTWSNPSIWRCFETTLENSIGVLFFGAVINDGSFGAAAWKMGRICVIADYAIMLVVIFHAAVNFAHQEISIN